MTRPNFRILRGHVGFAVLCAACTLASAEPPHSHSPTSQSAQMRGFAGTWDTTFGILDFRVKGDQVSGTYEMGGQPCQISGQMKNSRLEFTYQEPAASGQGWFELSADGTAFAGKWHKAGASEWLDWTGRRIQAKRPTGFDGIWSTNYGAMRISTADTKAHGTYAWAGGSTMTGRVTNDKFHFSYEQPDGEKGDAEFQLAADSASFTGTWKSKAGASGRWEGSRIKKVPGLIWLVVLEAPWESSIRSPEFSYGQMLRSFFARLPNIQMRHRFVHDARDLGRYCSELAYMPEPVVLYISSHGDETGLQFGSEHVDAKEIIRCLRNIPSLKVLHFGACLIMNGTIPSQICGSRAASERFPISGYTKTADWGQSAVVDIAYLDYILEHNMTPQDATVALKKNIRYAKSNGFAIFESDAAASQPAQ